MRNLVLPCVLTPHLPPFAIAHLTPYSLTILSLPTFHHSPAALAVPLSFPHWPSPTHSTLPSMACVLKRFPLTSPRKLSLPCVKRGFLRTAEPHRTSQLSPCAPLMSQCHVHAVPGSDVPCPCTTAPSAPPARELLSCPVSQPTTPTLRHRTSDSLPTFHPLPTRLSSSPHSLVITLPMHLPSLCCFHAVPLHLIPRYLPWRAY